jgi:hypothetical protein
MGASRIGPLADTARLATERAVIVVLGCSASYGGALDGLRARARLHARRLRCQGAAQGADLPGVQQGGQDLGDVGDRDRAEAHGDHLGYLGRVERGQLGEERGEVLGVRAGAFERDEDAHQLLVGAALPQGGQRLCFFEGEVVEVGGGEGGEGPVEEVGIPGRGGVGRGQLAEPLEASVQLDMSGGERFGQGGGILAEQGVDEAVLVLAERWR